MKERLSQKSNAENKKAKHHVENFSLKEVQEHEGIFQDTTLYTCK